jgi:hypothetical protein
MACNCLETSKENILAKLAEIHPTYSFTDSDFDNRIWCFDGPQDVILTHKFEYEYTFIKVNGTQSIPKKSSININPTYCGFCGKKFEDKD